MRYVICSSLLIFLCLLLLVPYSLRGHSVGEPELEELPIWRRCCGESDCIPQQIKIFGKKDGRKILVEIEEIQTLVDKEKFSPVPSARTWVCYRSRNGEINDDNIRCILYPQKDRIA